MGDFDTGDDESNRVNLEELPEHLVEDVINSKGFQKMLAYRRLAEGIEVLKENDRLKDELVHTIRSKHTNVSSRASVEEFFELFVEEVEQYTEGIVDETDIRSGDDPLDDLIVEEES